MTAKPTSLSFQRQCIEHLIALAATQASEGVLEGARHGVLALAWVERRQELLRALDRLERERPDLAELFQAFPGAEIVDVRPLFEGFYNGSGHDD